VNRLLNYFYALFQLADLQGAQSYLRQVGQRAAPGKTVLHAQGVQDSHFKQTAYAADRLEAVEVVGT
jgi:hypothetical protein